MSERIHTLSSFTHAAIQVHTRLLVTHNTQMPLMSLDIPTPHPNPPSIHIHYVCTRRKSMYAYVCTQTQEHKHQPSLRVTHGETTPSATPTPSIVYHGALSPVTERLPTATALFAHQHTRVHTQTHTTLRPPRPSARSLLPAHPRPATAQLPVRLRRTVP